MSALAFDTSAAIPFLVRNNAAHTAVRRHAAGRTPLLTTQSLAETYSVLTRPPGDARVRPEDAVRLIGTNVAEVLAVPEGEALQLPSVLAPLGIAGGAVHDALVGLAARATGTPLLTRDARAERTYRSLRVAIEIPAG